MGDEINRCIVCSNEMAPFGDPKKDVIELHKYQYFRCYHCGYMTVFPKPDKKRLERAYGKMFFNHNYNPELGSMKKIVIQRMEQYLQDIAYFNKWFIGPGKILDYGCGSGYFLKMFPDSFEKYGYEVNPYALQYIPEDVKIIKEFYGVTAFFHKPQLIFDVIVMRGVIEHLVDVHSILSLLSGLLRTGGIFFICATPNADSPAFLRLGLNWKAVTPPYHINFFSPRTIAELFRKYDIILKDCAFPYIGTPYADWPKDREQYQSGIAGPAFPGSFMSLILEKI